MDKIKSAIEYFIGSESGKDLLTVIIVLLVGLSSFGLGRLSKQPLNEGLKVEYEGEEYFPEETAGNLDANTTKAGSAVRQDSGQFFGSSKGSKYYPVGCAAGKSLKQENRIYFTSREAAETAGYTLSGSCR